MKITVRMLLSLIMALAMIAALIAGCSKEKPNDHGNSYDVIIQNPVYVTFPGADEEQKAAMDAYVEDFMKAYPKVSVFVDYPEELSEDDLVNSKAGSLDVLVLPEDQVYRYASELIVLMPVEYYAGFFGADIENMYDGAKEGMIDGHMYHVRMPQFSGGSGDGAPLGLAVYNRTPNPDASAAFALFFYTPEVPENGIWHYSGNTID